MSILEQQIGMSEAMANGRSTKWVKNVTISQLRDSERNSDIVSGYWPGGENLGGGRAPFMYPDNRTTFVGGDVVSSSEGTESIKDSKTAAALGDGRPSEFVSAEDVEQALALALADI